MLVDIECDSRHLDHVLRMLKREVQSVNFSTNIPGEEFSPMTPISASFGKLSDLIAFGGLTKFQVYLSLTIIIDNNINGT